VVMLLLRWWCRWYVVVLVVEQVSFDDERGRPNKQEIDALYEQEMGSLRSEVNISLHIYTYSY
jgi:hypothetical protein